MKRGFDYSLFLTTLLLVGIGLTMVFSASGILAKERFGDSAYFLKKEVIAGLIGMTGLVVARLLPVKLLSRLSLPLLVISLVLLAVVLFPSIGTKVSGASRWIRIGPLSLQPSEIAKLCLVIFVASVLAKRKERGVRVIPPMVASGLLIGLVLMGKDLGGAAVMGMTLFTLMFVGGARASTLVSELLLACPAFVYLVSSVPYRRMRILSFLNPWEHERGAGFQIIQSYIAFHAGSLFGLGLGDGKQKLFYLPEAHTDFIFSVIGEELGLFGTLTIVALFVIWLFRAFRIALKAVDPFSFYLALGIAVMIGIQVILNLAVVTGMLPTKGLPLPFISYGGTSLMVSLFSVGLLLNISARVNNPRSEG